MNYHTPLTKASLRETDAFQIYEIDRVLGTTDDGMIVNPLVREDHFRESFFPHDQEV